MENAAIFYGHLECSRPFGNVEVIWYIFHRFGTLRQEESGNLGGGSGGHPFFCDICRNTVAPVVEQKKPVSIGARVTKIGLEFSSVVRSLTLMYFGQFMKN
jgi:hypothetical protein